MKTIDCRNMACPAPVISTKKALEEADEIRVQLDDGAPRENVSRFARNRGYKVDEIQDETGNWLLTITNPNSTGKTAEAKSLSSDCVILITSNCFGSGPEEFGSLLMKNFIHSLLETSIKPTRIIFLNSGIFLTTEGSDVLESLNKLSGLGVEILSCGLCLDYFGRKEQLRVGSTTNMLVIAEELLGSERVIRL